MLSDKCTELQKLEENKLPQTWHHDFGICLSYKLGFKTVGFWNYHNNSHNEIQ